MNPTLIFNTTTSWLSKKIPKEIRIGFAIFLGILIISFTHYGANETSADVLFAEMIHTLADTLTITLLFIAFYVKGWLLKALGKISGLLLLLAGFAAFAKAYTTFAYTITTKDYLIERSELLLIVSIIAVVLIFFQIMLVWNEHDILHGHDLHTDKTDHSHEHLKNVHGAAKTELLADITQAFAGLIEYLFIIAIPSAPLLVRFVDFALTLGLGAWMIKRGVIILIAKEEHIHHKH